MHFLPPDFIKRRFAGLSLEDHCWEGSGGKGDESAGACATPAWASMYFLLCCVSVHTLYFSAVYHTVASRSRQLAGQR